MRLGTGYPNGPTRVGPVAGFGKPSSHPRSVHRHAGLLLPGTVANGCGYLRHLAAARSFASTMGRGQAFEPQLHQMVTGIQLAASPSSTQ
jgi:hypothetical protein